MSSGNSRIEDSRVFFENKYKIKFILEEFEKKIYEASDQLNEAIQIAHEMEEIATKRKAYYFLHRTRRLSLQLDDLKDSKGYEKKEFDFLYKIIDKIDENESSEFLDTVLRGTMERVASNLNTNLEPKIKPIQNSNTKSYFTFTYRGVHFIAPKKPRKIIENIDANKTYVRIGKKKFEIHPNNAFGISPDEDSINEPTNLCILKWSQDPPKYRCFFYHKMDQEIRFNESSVLSRLKTFEGGSNRYIKSYFRYAGVNYYLIEN
jgi:hypothetical protein